MGDVSACMVNAGFGLGADIFHNAFDARRRDEDKLVKMRVGVHFLFYATLRLPA
jgi:hypothetical protein